MNRLTRDGTADPVSRDQILRHARDQGNVHFPSSADHEQDWQPYPVDPYSAICDDHTYVYIHTYRKKKSKSKQQQKGKTKQNRTCTYYKFTSLALAPHVGLAQVRASPDVVVTQCFRPLFRNSMCHMPTLFAAGLLSRPSLTQLRMRPTSARDRPEGVEIFLGQSPRGVAGRPSRLVPCTTIRRNIFRFESLDLSCRTRASANPS